MEQLRRHEINLRRLEDAILPRALDTGHARRLISQKYEWKWLRKFVGLHASLVILKDEKGGTSRLFLRLPTSWTRLLMLRMKILPTGPCWPRVTFPVQNVVPEDSAIVRACRIGDLSTVQQLLSQGKAHPNDTTSENLTILRVGHSRSVSGL